MKNNLKVSIFTPTHNSKYINELYNTIKEQDFYEWIIVTNNGAKVSIDDPRIKVFNYEHTFVGALKKYACSKCSGDIFLEVDHDDLLTNNAIKELKRVLAKNGSLLFVVPVGQPKIEFNAHRIYSYEQIFEYFKDLTLKEFSLITDNGDFIENAKKELVKQQKYGCGCFWFIKK